MRIYLDHNILDALSKDRLVLQVPDDTVWVFSSENFNEIKRSNDMRFLDVLKNLKARMLEVEFDQRFMMTGRALLNEYRDPHELYSEWVACTKEVRIDEGLKLQMEFMARLAGANNHDEIIHHPDRLKDFLNYLLSGSDLMRNELESQIENVINDIKLITNGSIQAIGSLDVTREALGVGKSKVNNVACQSNTLELIWQLISDEFNGMTIEQFYGFEPLNKLGYDNWPIYLGVVSCHTVLNFIGYHPDKGLSKIGNIPGISSDANYTAMGIFCDAILSSDRRFCAKARAIYQYLGMDIQVIEVLSNAHLGFVE